MEAVLRRSLPPLNALRSFEAAARHQSFTRAADELCVTQGAVSHQVKALEAEFGLKLFNRERQGLVITEAGHDYLAVVRDAFDRIALGTDRLLQRLHSGVITVSTSPDFAAKWLISRLGRFRACPYRSRCGRSDQWSLGAAVPDRPAPEKYLLDRVPQGDFGTAKDCRVP
jgi:DNA-binding transcriptional LysR family regulator